MTSTLPASVAFDGADLTIIDHDGRPWLTAADLARALGYADTSAVTRIHARHADEFTDTMTVTVKLTVPGNPLEVPVRIFSPRGCYAVAMFARTPKAAAFRRWVLDVLEGLTPPPAPEPASLPLPEPEAELLRAMLETVMLQFCGRSPADRQLADLQTALTRATEDLRQARLWLHRTEHSFRELCAPTPSVVQAREALVHRRRAAAAPAATQTMDPATRAELESLGRDLGVPLHVDPVAPPST